MEPGGAVPRPGPARGTEPFLSVVIPTYNRASQLDRQLGWLHRELSALEVTWEVRVHDNCSTDTTPEVTARWRSVFGEDRFHVVRNPENIGGIPNLSHAIESAVGRWTWSIGDDDRIYDGTAQEVVDLLQAQPDLALLYLNYRGVQVDSGEVRIPHYFEPSVTGRYDDGRPPFVYHATEEIGIVIFLTATVYRTPLVHAAIRSWRHQLDNWALVAYWAGYVAAHGPIFITTEIKIDCVLNTSHWQGEPGRWERAAYDEIPRVYLELSRHGYTAEECRAMGFSPLRQTRRPADVKSHLRALRYAPQSVLSMGELLTLRRFRSR